jgi:DNA-binding PadR family transcriptional regulator
MTTYYELTGFRRDLLEAIAAVGEQPYGLALKAYLDERYAEPINPSRLYQNLDRLVDFGLVNRESLDDRTNAYTLTDAGQRQLTHHTETLASLCDHSRPVSDGGQKRSTTSALRTTHRPQFSTYTACGACWLCLNAIAATEVK